MVVLVEKVLGSPLRGSMSYIIGLANLLLRVYTTVNKVVAIVFKRRCMEAVHSVSMFLRDY